MFSLKCNLCSLMCKRLNDHFHSLTLRYILTSDNSVATSFNIYIAHSELIRSYIFVAVVSVTLCRHISKWYLCICVSLVGTKLQNGTRWNHQLGTQVLMYIYGDPSGIIDFLFLIPYLLFLVPCPLTKGLPTLPAVRDLNPMLTNYSINLTVPCAIWNLEPGIWNLQPNYFCLYPFAFCLVN